MIEAATRAFQPVSSISPRLRATDPRMKLNSPTCEKAAADRNGVASGVPRARTVSKAPSGLTTITTASTSAISSGACHQAPGIEQHADRDEEEHGEGVAHRHGVARGSGCELGAADGQAREERAERHRHAEEPGRADRDPHGEHQHREGEQLARAGLLDALERPGDRPSAPAPRRSDQPDDLEAGQAQGGPARWRRRPPAPNRIGSSSSRATVRMSSTTVQPIAMWPIGACRSCRSASTSAITTVLATEMAIPRMSPETQLQPDQPQQQRQRQRGQRALDEWRPAGPRARPRSARAGGSAARCRRAAGSRRSRRTARRPRGRRRSPG